MFSNLIPILCHPYSPCPFDLWYWILEQNGSCLVQIKKPWRRTICRHADRFKWIGNFLKYPRICPWSFLRHFPTYGKYTVPTVNPHHPLLSPSTWWPLSLPNYPPHTHTHSYFSVFVWVCGKTQRIDLVGLHLWAQVRAIYWIYETISNAINAEHDNSPVSSNHQLPIATQAW